MYKKGQCNQYYASILHVEKAKATVTIPLKNDFHHSGGAVHGSVYFKALDDAAFFAVNSLVKDVLVLTVSFNLYFIRPVSSGLLKAEGCVVSASKRLFLAESTLYDEREKEIARGSGSFLKGRVRLTDKIGYH